MPLSRSSPPVLPASCPPSLRPAPTISQSHNMPPFALHRLYCPLHLYSSPPPTRSGGVGVAWRSTLQIRFVFRNRGLSRSTTFGRLRDLGIAAAAIAPWRVFTVLGMHGGGMSVRQRTSGAASHCMQPGGMRVMVVLLITLVCDHLAQHLSVAETRRSPVRPTTGGAGTRENGRRRDLTGPLR